MSPKHPTRRTILSRSLHWPLALVPGLGLLAACRTDSRSPAPRESPSSNTEPPMQTMTQSDNPAATAADAIRGIHHITAIASDPQRNLDFYALALGLRFVKRTVNFDDPGSYHLYYGDAAGAPGTVLTFFPWPKADRGVNGAGAVTATAFAVPKGSIAAWQRRLESFAADPDTTIRPTILGRETRFGDDVLRFEDHDGMQLELIETDWAAQSPHWAGGGVEPSMAIRGFHGATLTVRRPVDTATMLTTRLGMRQVAQSGERTRFESAPLSPADSAATPGRFIDLLHRPDAPGSRLGAGVVHHIAVRAADDAQQGRWQRSLADSGMRVTPVQNRNYFRSIYYRERNGVLFEIATDRPGFTIDEPADALGMGLMLPEQYESTRARIRSHLLPVTIPTPAFPALGSHVHRLIPGRPGAKTLLLLHGTGADETDLLPLADKLDPDATRLSPRGNVLEGDQPRFFRRLREGVFDLDDLARRSSDLAAWFGDASKTYGLAPQSTTAVGFSNGANTAAAMLLLNSGGRPQFHRAVLIRAMVTVRPTSLPDLRGVSILLLSGDTDSIVPVANAAELAAMLRQAGAAVDHQTLSAGHSLTGEDIALARAFIQR